MQPSPQQQPCSKCHTPLQPNVRFCTNCGTAVKSRKSLQERLQWVKQAGQRVQGWISRLPWARLRELPQAVRDRLPYQPHWLAQYSARSKVAAIICTGLLLSVMVWDLSSQGGTEPVDPVEVAAAAVKLPTVTKLIDKNGGTIELNGFKMEIPKGALKHEIAFTVVQTADADHYTPPPGSMASLSDHFKSISSAFNISPEITFSKPVTLSFPIDAKVKPVDQSLSARQSLRFGGSGTSLMANIPTIFPAILAQQATQGPWEFPPGLLARLLQNGNPISTWGNGPSGRPLKLSGGYGVAPQPVALYLAKGRIGGTYQITSIKNDEWDKFLTQQQRKLLTIEKRFVSALKKIWPHDGELTKNAGDLESSRREMESLAAEAQVNQQLKQTATPAIALRLRALFWKARISEQLFRTDPRKLKEYHTALRAYEQVQKEWTPQADANPNREGTIVPTISSGDKHFRPNVRPNSGQTWRYLLEPESRNLVYQPLNVGETAVKQLNTICPFGTEVYFYLHEKFNSEGARQKPSSFFDGISPQILFVGGGKDGWYHTQTVERYVGRDAIDRFAKAYPAGVTTPVVSVARAFESDTVSIEVTRTMFSPDFVNRGKPVDYSFDVPYKILLGKLGGPFDLFGDLLFDQMVDLANVYNVSGTYNMPIHMGKEGRRYLKLLRPADKKFKTESGREYIKKVPKGNLTDLYQKPAKLSVKELKEGAIPWFGKDLKNAGKLRKWLETSVVPFFETAWAVKDAGKRTKALPSLQKWYDAEFLAKVLNNYKVKEFPLNQMGTNYLTDSIQGLSTSKRNPIPLIEVTVEGVPSGTFSQIDQFPIKVTHVYAFHLNLSTRSTRVNINPFHEVAPQLNKNVKLTLPYSPRPDGQYQFDGQLDRHWQLLGNGPITRLQLANPGAGVVFKVKGLPGKDGKLLGADDKGNIQRWETRVNAQQKIEIEISSAYGRKVMGREFFTSEKAQQWHKLSGTASKSNTAFLRKYNQHELQEPGVMSVPVVPRVIKELDTGEDPLITAAVQSGLSLPKKFYVKVKIKDDKGKVVRERDFRINLEKGTGAEFSTAGDLLCATLDMNSEIDWEEVVRKFSLAHSWPDPDDPEIKKWEKLNFDFEIERFQQGKEPARPVNYHAAGSGKEKRPLRQATGAIRVAIFENESEAIAMDEYWMRNYKKWPSTWPDTHRYHEFRPQNTPFEVRVASSLSSSVYSKTTSGHANVFFQIGKATISLACGADWLRKEDRSAQSAARKFVKKASDEWVMEVLKLADTCRK